MRFVGLVGLLISTFMTSGSGATVGGKVMTAGGSPSHGAHIFNEAGRDFIDACKGYAPTPGRSFNFGTGAPLGN